MGSVLAVLQALVAFQSVNDGWSNENIPLEESSTRTQVCFVLSRIKENAEEGGLVDHRSITNGHLPICDWVS